MFNSFDFDDDSVFYQQIGKVFPHHLASIIHINRRLLLNNNSAIPQLQRQRILINLLQKSMSKRILNTIKRLHNLLSDNLPILHKVASICVVFVNEVSVTITIQATRAQ